MDKVQIFHFHNGTGGGVLSVIKNLIKYSKNPLVENHIIHTINKDEIKFYNVDAIEGVVTQQVFFYTPKNNFYNTCKHLAKLLPDEKAVIVAHDWLELGMASNLGLQNPTVQILHGDFDYYYELAQKNENIIDSFICISPTIFKKLNECLPNKQNDIVYLNFPVPDIKTKRLDNTRLHLIYLVRDLKDGRKQFNTIIKIAEGLSSERDNYFFTIAGGGYTKEAFFDVWPKAMKNNVNYLGTITNEMIVEILPSQDIFLLPSVSEGLPVSLVEAMKAGVVPLITNWDGAVDELVIDKFSGYFIKIGDFSKYVEIIKGLSNDRNELRTISKNCSARANESFSPTENTKKMEAAFIRSTVKNNNIKESKKVYGSRLDQKWIPNRFTKLLR